MMRNVNYVLLGAVLGAASFGVAQKADIFGRPATAAISDTYRSLNLFGDVFERIRAEYVEPVNDRDLIEAAINGIAMGLLFNSGQVCAAGTRILVHRSLYDAVVEGLAGAASAQTIGDPFDSATTMGALVNARQQRRVLDYIEKGKAEGGRVVAGGGRHEGKGFFVEPTIFTDLDNSSALAQEEIFGPVGVVIAFDSLDEAIEIANDTMYGLAATIWTQNVSAAHTTAAKIRAGAVWINGWAAIDPALPWGGMKSSGIGRELGWSGILANTEEKVVTVVL